jgi:hypothetical protein
MKRFTDRLKYCMKNVIFRLHGIVVMGNSVCNNTRYASADFGYHAHPGGLLFGGLGDEIR